MCYAAYGILFLLGHMFGRLPALLCFARINRLMATMYTSQSTWRTKLRSAFGCFAVQSVTLEFNQPEKLSVYRSNNRRWSFSQLPQPAHVGFNAVYEIACDPYPSGLLLEMGHVLFQQTR